MKHFILLSLLCVFLINSKAQTFTETTIGSNLLSPDNITRVDLDKDGDIDILCFEGDTDIEYFVNDGSGNFSQRTIYTFLDSPRYFEVADMDNDGELDIVACSIGDDQTVLLKNDGSENFTQSFITNGNAELINPGFFTIANFDDDNLKDIVISASSAIGDALGLFFIKNNGNGSFSSPQEIQADDDMIQQVVSGDFDGDTDMDIVVTRSSYFSSKGLYKGVNNGSGSFVYSAIDETFRCDQLEIVDFDFDTDMDFIIRKEDNSIYWYENDGSFNFTPHEIPHTQTDLIYFQAIDAGSDNDMDLFFYTFVNASISESRFKLGIIENDGLGGFSEVYYLENLDEIESAFAEDIGNDGDIDFFIGSYQNSTLVEYKNTTINLPTQLDNPIANLTEVYPNPADNFINVDNPEVITSVVISDITGREVKVVQVNDAYASIDISELSSGIYNLLINTEEVTSMKRIVKK